MSSEAIAASISIGSATMGGRIKDERPQVFEVVGGTASVSTHTISFDEENQTVETTRTDGGGVTLLPEADGPAIKFMPSDSVDLLQLGPIEFDPAKTSGEVEKTPPFGLRQTNTTEVTKERRRARSHAEARVEAPDRTAVRLTVNYNVRDNLSAAAFAEDPWELAGGSAIAFESTIFAGSRLFTSALASGGTQLFLSSSFAPDDPLYVLTFAAAGALEGPDDLLIDLVSVPSLGWENDAIETELRGLFAFDPALGFMLSADYRLPDIDFFSPDRMRLALWRRPSAPRRFPFHLPAR